MHSKYAEANGLDKYKFAFMKYRFHYKKYTNPEEYYRVLPIGQAYINSDLSKPKFLNKYAYDIQTSILTAVGSHVNHLNIIERIKREKGLALDDETPIPPPAPIQSEPDSKGMSFYQVPSSKAIAEHVELEPDHAEILQKQNEIEITINQGVKVIVSPHIDSMKIIKIINLLKDL
jgi:hypothetical protein